MTNNQPELKEMPEEIFASAIDTILCGVNLVTDENKALKLIEQALITYQSTRADLTPKWQSMEAAIKHLKISYQIDEDHQSEYVKILPIHAQNIIDYLENIKGETK